LLREFLEALADKANQGIEVQVAALTPERRISARHGDPPSLHLRGDLET
jgi:hypothetical protein